MVGHDKLRYRCTRCGSCCRWAGYVRITEREAESIAEYLGLSLDEFLERYTRLTGDRRGLSLTESAEGHCIFLEEDTVCRIQPVKPRQCREFPNFWNFPGFRSCCESVDTWEQEDEKTG